MLIVYNIMSKYNTIEALENYQVHTSRTVCKYVFFPRFERNASL